MRFDPVIATVPFSVDRHTLKKHYLVDAFCIYIYLFTGIGDSDEAEINKADQEVKQCAYYFAYLKDAVLRSKTKSI